MRTGETEYIHAERLFTGEGDDFLRDQLVGIAGERIVDVRAFADRPAGARITRSATIVAPGFVDLQINGAGGVLFNDRPCPDALEEIATAARQGGTAYLLPTFITAPGDAFGKALCAAERAVAAASPGILGIHLEGPFLSPKRPGIHPAGAIRPLTDRDMDRLTARRRGRILLTLAPEHVPPAIIGRLVESGLTVFAGHTEAPFETMATAAAAGLSGVTHLFNAMAPIAGRAPGPAGSALGNPALYASIIADARHVHPANLALAAQAKGPHRLILVSDAMPTLGQHPPHPFTLGGRTIALQDGRLTDETGTLAGAHLAMDEAVATMVRLAGVKACHALRMASTTPAEAIGAGDRIGRVLAGYRASLTLLDETFRAHAVIVDGTTFERNG